MALCPAAPSFVAGGHRQSKEPHLMESFQPSPHHLEHQRRTKFTPERIRQINNLVERGTSPAEIAEIVGVTLGTLKTTCSKLHISLRRPYFDTGTGLLRLRRRRGGSGQATVSSKKTPVETIPPEQKHAATLEREPMRQEPITAPQDQPTTRSLALVSIVMQYKGESHTAELPLTHDLIGQLAIEAEFRRTSLVQLIALAVESLAKEDYFDLLLGQLPSVSEITIDRPNDGR
jgi:hypothetical protein